MGIDCYQLKEFIIKPAISSLGLGGDNAVHLLLLTAAQETALGRYLVQKQIEFSGGIGIYQMESPTYHYVWNREVAPYPAMRAKIKLYLGYQDKPPIPRLASDLALATIMARLYYATFKEPLPNCNEIPKVAAYWKKYWNTVKGKGTVEQAIKNYEMYVANSQDH